jgi:hypothetical protein
MLTSADMCQRMLTHEGASSRQQGTLSVDIQKISAKSLHSIAAVRKSFVESPVEPYRTSVEEYAMAFESNVV